MTLKTQPGRTPPVTLVVPAYNHAVYLAQAIDSVLGQDYPNIELIVLDDNSTDATAAIAVASGATVVSVNTVNDVYGPGRGKGEALRWAFARLLELMAQEKQPLSELYKLIPPFHQKTALVDCPRQQKGRVMPNKAALGP